MGSVGSLADRKTSAGRKKLNRTSAVRPIFAKFAPAIVSKTNTGWPDGGEIDITNAWIIIREPTRPCTPIVRLHRNKAALRLYGTNRSLRLQRLCRQDVCRPIASACKQRGDIHTYPHIDTESDGQFPFDATSCLLLGMQPGGRCAGEADSSGVAAERFVDRVRFYQPTK